MAVFISNTKEELMVTCGCGCEDAVHIRIFHEDNYDYALFTYLNGNWYRDQDDTILRVIGRKIRKIWAIIRNKDYYYSDVQMSKADFEVFKEYINNF